MAFSNESDLPAFLSPRNVILKISIIPEDALLRMAKSQLTTSRNLRGRAIPACHQPALIEIF
jgi:hypothetical protein